MPLIFGGEIDEVPDDEIDDEIDNEIQDVIFFA